MQATHHAFVAIQQVLTGVIQFLEAAVQSIERQRLYFDASQFQRLIFLSIRVTDVDYDLARQHFADFFDLQVLAQFLR